MIQGASSQSKSVMDKRESQRAKTDGCGQTRRTKQRAGKGWYKIFRTALILYFIRFHEIMSKKCFSL